MEIDVQVALIAATGVAVGALLTLIGSVYSARQKVQELELRYVQQLQDRYFENARKHTEDVYEPLNASLSRLITKYEYYRSSLDFSTGDADGNLETEFRDSVTYFVQRVEQLSSQGAETYFTSELEERLRPLILFLKLSLIASEPTTKLMVSYGYRITLLGHTVSYKPRTLSRVIKGRKSGLSDFQEYSIGLPSFIPFSDGGVSAKLQTELISASIRSREFEEHIVTEVTFIKALIKRVTLGATPK